MKFVVKLFYMVAMSISLYGESTFTELQYDWANMKPEERFSIYESYMVGKSKDIGYSLAAINWQESKGGRWLYSTDHSDYGVYHVNLTWYMRTMDIENTLYNRVEWGSKLIKNRALGESYAIGKLLGLVERFNGDYMKVWKAYNGSNERAAKYAKEIRAKVRFLRAAFGKGE